MQSSSGTNAGRAALLAQGGAIFAQRYGSKVGIEDVGIETDLNDETSWCSAATCRTGFT